MGGDVTVVVPCERARDVRGRYSGVFFVSRRVSIFYSVVFEGVDVSKITVDFWDEIFLSFFFKEEFEGEMF